MIYDMSSGPKAEFHTTIMRERDVRWRRAFLVARNAKDPEAAAAAMLAVKEEARQMFHEAQKLYDMQVVM